ncbi:MAG: ATP-binding protein [Chlorobi bacterium]|nr:ATP-binding protein [Chlorobiota bacterium]
MFLDAVRIQKYKRIKDSGWVRINRMTALVGKNESGKTSFLRALHRLNPYNEEDSYFNIIKEYPRDRYAADRDKEKQMVVSARFNLAGKEITEINAAFGVKCLTSEQVIVHKHYDNSRTFEYAVDEKKFLREFVSAHIPELAAKNLSYNDVAQCIAALNSVKESTDNPALKEKIDKLAATLRNRFRVGITKYIFDTQIFKRIPRFIYFDEYSSLNGTIYINDIIQRKRERRLSKSDRTFLTLCDLAGITLEDLVPDDIRSSFEDRQIKMEAASIAVTDKVAEYWSQSEYETQFKLDNDVLSIMIRDLKNRVSINFDERSRGFIWFFSFFTVFMQESNGQYSNTILLLDEPGINLHASAQADLIRVFDSLSKTNQIIYTTHSPFMLDTHSLTNIRIVEESGHGTIVRTDFNTKDAEALFPLQAAFSFSAVHSLFKDVSAVVVENLTDYWYLQSLNELLRASGKTHLRNTFTISPLGSNGNITSLLALLFAHRLKIVMLPSTRQFGFQVDQSFVEHLLKQGNIIPLGSILDRPEAGIEDLIEEPFYLALVNDVYKSQVQEPVLTSKLDRNIPRIVPRLEKHFEEKYSIPFQAIYPAQAFMNQLRDKGLRLLPETTIRNFETLFDRINAVQF